MPSRHSSVLGASRGSPVGGACFAARVDTTHFIYIGPPAYASALAQELQTQGLTADYKPPFETRRRYGHGRSGCRLRITGPLKDILAGVRAFKSRFAGTQIDGLPDGDRPSVRERLTHVDGLLADRVITADENSQQRTRILDEL